MRPTARMAPTLLVCLLTLCLAACQGATSPAPTPVLVPTKTAAPSNTPAPAPTFTDTPPASPTPTATPTPIDPRLPLHTIQYLPHELVLALAWSPDGRSLAVSTGETIHLLETGSFSPTLALPAAIWSPALAWSPDGAMLASGGRDGRVQIWDAAAGRLLLAFAAHKKGTNTLVYNPGGNVIASGGNDAVARLWDPLTGENLGQMIGGTFAVPAAVFTPDGLSLAVVNGTVIRLRDVASGRFVQTLRSEQAIFSAAMHPQGGLLAGGSSSGSVILWRTADAAIVAQFPATQVTGVAGLVWRLAFSPDGRRLAAVTGAGNLVVWNVENQALELDLPAHRLAATSLSWSPDGARLATGGLDAAVHIWQMPPMP